LLSKIDAKHTITIIVETDPAIDLDSEQCNWPLYKATLDESHLVFKKDQDPTRFEIGLIPYRHLARIQDGAVKGVNAGPASERVIQVTPYLSAVEFVRHGVVDIKNLDGLEFKRTGTPRVVPDDVMNMISAWGVMAELSDHVMTFNKVTEDDTKN